MTVDYSRIEAEINVPGHHYLTGNTRDILLSGLELLTARYRWDYAGSPLSDSQWDALQADIGKALEEVLVRVNTDPVGSLDWYAGIDPLPDGWLLCDGTIYNVADYPLLAAKLSNTYGGNGTTTFAVPLIDERFIRATLIQDELGDEAGSDITTLSIANLPAHTHGYSYPSVGVDVEAPGVPDFTAVGNPPTTLQTGSTGGGDAFSVTNPYVKMRPIIRARGDAILEFEIPAVSGFIVSEIRWFATNQAVTGWIPCDGTAYLTSQFPDLFNAIGYSYGGSGPSFNVPDYRQRSAVMLDASDTDYDTMGKTGGAKTHTLTIAEMPAHQHTITTQTTAASGTVRNDVRNVGGSSSTPIGVTGGDQPHNNTSPYIVGFAQIRAIP